ncbi:hypothetical protein SMJ63A_30148 [Stenotrophomonas geniculata]
MPRDPPLAEWRGLKNQPLNFNWQGGNVVGSRIAKAVRFLSSHLIRSLGSLDASTGALSGESDRHCDNAREKPCGKDVCAKGGCY